MTKTITSTTAVGVVHQNLIRNFPGPYFATPCGVLSPLLSLLETSDDYHCVPREDNAIGMAAGAWMAGASPVVLMQNSGLGQSVNALASLVVPYSIPMLLIVSMRGMPPDPTEENQGMARLTPVILRELGMEYETLCPEQSEQQFEQAARWVKEKRLSRTLLVMPDAFDWKA